MFKCINGGVSVKALRQFVEGTQKDIWVLVQDMGHLTLRIQINYYRYNT